MTKRDMKSLVTAGGIGLGLAALIYWLTHRSKVIAEIAPVEVVWDNAGRVA